MNEAEPPVKYTLGQAAKATGKAKGTISNAIKQGRLSAHKNEKGEYEIDAAELHRVYETASEQSKVNVVPSQNEQVVSQVERDALEARIALLEQMLERERENGDEWRKQAQTLALAPPAKDDTAPRGRFGAAWAALTGKQ